jgi:hypothetical protein
MALFKSQNLTQASGSVGGLTFTRTPSGMVMRARSMPVNPRTALQQVVRNAFAQLAVRWVQTLTEDQRIGWADYGAAVTRRNKLGDQFHLSGLAEYQRANVPRVQAGLAIIDTAPGVFDSGEPLDNFRLSQSITTPFAVTALWGAIDDTDANVLIYVSKPRNQSINFFKGPYQFNAVEAAEDTPTILTPNPTWVKGQVLFVRAQISYSDGRLSPDSNVRFVLEETPV